MKRLLSPLLVSGLSAFLLLTHSHSGFAISETYADAVVAGQYVDDRHQASPPAAPDSSAASYVTATAAAYANAFNTGKLGASASAANGTSTWAYAHITDTLYLNLPQAIPSADGMIFYLQLHGSATSNWNTTYPNAYSSLVVTVFEDGLVLAIGCLSVQSFPNSGLYAPTLCDGVWENAFLDPLNAPYYPLIGAPGHSFSFNVPLFMIMKGMTPVAFNGKEFTVAIQAKVSGPGSSSFLNTLEFDPVHPIQLYASSTQSAIPLPPGASYRSGSGLGIPQTPVVVPPLATLDVDASISATKYDALTDGLITMRYLFGVTGLSMTNGLLGGTATRTDPAVIKTYLDAIRTSLDIDGNNTADASTDGLLIIRYLFGLRGDSLIAGAFDPLGSRNTSTAIEMHIQSLMP